MSFSTDRIVRGFFAVCLLFACVPADAGVGGKGVVRVPSGTAAVGGVGVPITLTSITVTPANATISTSTQQYTATGHYSDGSTQNLTSSVTWGSSDNTVATIDSTGLLTVVGSGSTTVSAVLGVTGSTGATVPAASFDFDLTQTSVPRGVTITRSGAVAWGMMSANSIQEFASSAPVYENRGDTSGYWSFDSFQNYSSPNDFTSWTNVQGATLTSNVGVGPDGVTNYSTLADTSVSLGQGLKIAGTLGVSDPAIALWVRDTSGNAPTTSGAISTFMSGDQTWKATSTSSGSTWRWITAFAPSASGGGQIAGGIMPAGQTPVSGNFSTVDVSAIGSLDIWGVSRTADMHGIVPPIVNGTTSAQTIQASAEALSQMLNANGDLDVEGEFDSDVPHTSNPDDPGYLFTAAMPTGNARVYMTGSSTANFQVGSGANFTWVIGQYVPGGVVRWRVVHKPSESKRSFEVRQNGCWEESSLQVLSGAASALSTPTAVYLGSNLGSTSFPRRHTLLRRTNRATSTLWSAEGVVLGDSTSAGYLGNLYVVGQLYYTAAQSRDTATHPGIQSLAVTGETINQQLAHWQASPLRGSISVNFVTVMVGLNDVFQNHSAAVIEADLQALVSDVHTNNPGAYIYLAPMTPAGAVMSPGQLTVWNTVNAFIEAGGITGGPNLYVLPLWAALDNGSGSLNATCNSGDGIHENNFCRITYVGPTFVDSIRTNGGWL